MNNEHNFETDTKLFQIRFHNVYMGEVWAADASSALSKAQSLYPDAPKHLFEIKFVANLYPVKKLTINDIRAALDARQVPYQDPCGDEHQLILRGTADIIEGGYGQGEDRWELYIRASEGKPSQSFMFKDVAELAIHLDAAYVQQPYDEYSAQPLSV